MPTEWAPSKLLQKQSLNPESSSDGEAIAFVGAMDRAIGNPCGTPQLFMLREGDSQHLQLTAIIASLTLLPSISADGAFVAFYSDADPFGTNPKNGLELFHYSFDLSEVISSMDNECSDIIKPEPIPPPAK